MLSFYDKIAHDDMETNPDNIVIWYLMSKYSNDAEENPILNNLIYDRLVQKLSKDFENFDHEFKSCIKFDLINKKLTVIEFPKCLKNKLNTLRMLK